MAFKCEYRFPGSCNVSCSTGTDTAGSVSSSALAIGLGIGIPVALLVIVGLTVCICFCFVKKSEDKRIDRQQKQAEIRLANDERVLQAEMEVKETKQQVQQMQEQLKYTSFTGSYAGEFLKEWMIDFRELSFDKEIGRGSQGAVWLGKMKQAKVAIKLATSRTVDESAAEALKTEAKLILYASALMPFVAQYSLRLAFTGVCADTRTLCRPMEFASTKADSTLSSSIARAGLLLASLGSLPCLQKRSFASRAISPPVWVIFTLQACYTMMLVAEICC